jgi:hypothetical protein
VLAVLLLAGAFSQVGTAQEVISLECGRCGGEVPKFPGKEGSMSGGSFPLCYCEEGGRCKCT